MPSSSSAEAHRMFTDGVADVGTISSQPLFQFNTLVGFLVAVLDDDRGVKRNPPVSSLAAPNRTRARYYHCTLRHLERLIPVPTIGLASHQVIQWRGPSKDRSCPKYRACSDQGSFVHTAVSADENVVFNDHGRRVHRFQ